MNNNRAFRKRLKNTFGFAGLLFLTAACAAPQNRPDNTSQELIAPVISRPDGAVGISTNNREVANLWASAERARLENKNTIALELLYEAMDIDPQNSLLWSRAAEIMLDSVEPALAEDYAVRSNSLAGENRPLLHRNWLIIEHARSMRGDLLGVRSAHKQVEIYEVR